MKALIVEDDLVVSGVFRSWFEKIGFEVSVAESRAQAELILADAPPPSVITVDINLIDIRGEETIAWVRELRIKHPDALLLVISGVLQPADVPRLAELGADGAFEKMEVSTEKSWWQKLLDAVSGVSKQEPLTRNLESLRAIAAKVTSVYNNNGASLRLPTGSEEVAMSSKSP